MGRRRASCSPATACADAKRCSSDGSTPGIVFAQRVPTPGTGAMGNTVGGVVGTTTHRRKEACGVQAMVANRSVC